MASNLKVSDVAAQQGKMQCAVVCDMHGTSVHYSLFTRPSSYAQNVMSKSTESCVMHTDTSRASLVCKYHLLA
jgi:hypothetical protein